MSAREADEVRRSDEEADEREDVERDHERRLDASCARGAPFRCRSRPTRAARGLQSIRVACSARRAFSPGLLAPEVDDLVAVEPHLRALVHATSACPRA